MDVSHRYQPNGKTTPRLLALLILWAWPLMAAAADLEHADGVLWRVEGAGAEPSHVFGTIHSDDPRVLKLRPAIESAFRSAGRYAFELDFDRDLRTTMAQAMFDRAPPRLDQQLGEQDWARARSAARERGIPGEALPLMDPWALAVTLSMPPMDTQRTLDRVLFRRAAALGRPTHGLETAEEQLALFEELPEAQQIELLRGALELAEGHRLAPMFEALTDAWLRGDLQALMEISERNPMLPDAAQNDAFFERVIDARNRRMVERMQPLLARGNAFVAVGALHLPGPEGILRLLEELGYTVSRAD